MNASRDDAAGKIRVQSNRGGGCQWRREGWATGAEEGGHADLCRSMEPRPSSREPHIFANPMATAAAIDRAVHHSVILEFDVPSYRTGVAQQRGQKKGVNRQE